MGVPSIYFTALCRADPFLISKGGRDKKQKRKSVNPFSGDKRAKERILKTEEIESESFLGRPVLPISRDTDNRKEREAV